MLKVNLATSVGAGVINEDVVGFTESAAWVFDGATGVGGMLTPGPSDAAWFANRASATLARMLRDTPEIPTPDALRNTMADCRDAFARVATRPPIDAFELPSAAFAMVRQTGATVELTTLGDCRIAYRVSGRPELFGATALAPLDARSISFAASLRQAKPTIDAAGFNAAMLPHLRQMRSRMNTPEGYWIFGVEPAAADHVDRITIAAVTGDRFALASDGFLRLIEVFGVAEADDFLAIDTSARFATELERLRALERAPGTLADHPRIKRHDDVAFVQCEYRLED